MSFIVLCILSKNSDKKLFLKDLNIKASEIFKDEKVHTREVDVFYRAASSSALGSQTIEAGKQVFLDDSESNPCPVCLERLIDSSNPPSLFTMLCQHTFHASCLLAWGGIRCPLCRRTHTVGHSEEMASRDSTGPDSLTRRCQVCATGEDIFVCLGCGHEGCGKSKQGHAMAHAADMHHQMGLQVSTNSVYDLNTFRPIYNLTVKPCAQKPHAHLESSSLRDGGKEKHFEEIRMLRAQLVSQSHHFNALLQETDETHQQLLSKLERLNSNSFMKKKAPDLRALCSRIAIQKASNQELEAQIKSLKDSRSYYLERGDSLAAQLSKDKAELHQLSSTSLDLEKELASRMKLLS
ncbi:hypothetical protein DSO57_1032771 [Entomophthora muscae]|uniref:Uncharacterized protein n=1 Tax=Entomophthora muscae TaxID=34485 RepID=A0ACC2U9W9_9FUNG|nr:hypothetical protein DSO57_1032771 [Entomophthora muscae]